MSVLESKDKSKDVITNIITSVFDKDVSRIITGYYFLISEQFKLELNNVMNDRSNRKLQYFKFPESTNFIIRFRLYEKNIIIDLFKQWPRNIESREVDISYRIIIKHKRLHRAFKNNLPPVLSKKSFNKLTKKEFLLI